MPAFEYQALNSAGKMQQGILEGDSEKLVRQQLRDQGLMPTKLTEIANVSQTSKMVKSSFFSSKVPTADLSLFTRELYTLLDAGTPLNDALRSMSQQKKSKLMTRFVTTLHNKVAEGHSLANALTQAPVKIDKDVIATVRAGEESGNLDKVLSRLADAIEQRDQLHKKIKTAMIYPILMVVVAILIVLFLMVYVVPKVVKVFANMEQNLPPLTQGLLNISDFIQQQWGILLLLVIGIWLSLQLIMHRPTGRFKIHQLLLVLPGLRSFLINSTVARWSRTLGVLLASGVSIQDALKIASEVVTLEPIKAKTVEMGVDVREGLSVAKAMEKANFFPPLLMNLVATGEGKGKLDAMLLKGAKHYEFSVETSANTLISILEPILIIIMGVVVLTIVLAIMMPIFQMNQMVAL